MGCCLIVMFSHSNERTWLKPLLGSTGNMHADQRRAVRPCVLQHSGRLPIPTNEETSQVSAVWARASDVTWLLEAIAARVKTDGAIANELCSQPPGRGAWHTLKAVQGGVHGWRKHWRHVRNLWCDVACLCRLVLIEAHLRFIQIHVARR